MKFKYIVIGMTSLLVLGGCASIPSGPSVMALPGSSKTFDEFRFDDSDCQHYAFQQIGGTTAEQAANDSAIRTAAVGTVVGAVAGAAIGGSRGAGIGAGTGLIFGSVAGTSEHGQRSAYGTQKRYDNAYVQCMYSKGHRVPVSASMSQMMQQSPPPAAYSPPATVDGRRIPRPPSGSPPPPPPGY